MRRGRTHAHENEASPHALRLRIGIGIAVAIGIDFDLSWRPSLPMPIRMDHFTAIFGTYTSTSSSQNGIEGAVWIIEVLIYPAGFFLRK